MRQNVVGIYLLNKGDMEYDEIVPSIYRDTDFMSEDEDFEIDMFIVPRCGEPIDGGEQPIVNLIISGWTETSSEYLHEQMEILDKYLRDKYFIITSSVNA